MKDALKWSVKFYVEKKVIIENPPGGQRLTTYEPAIFKQKNKKYTIPNIDNPYLTDSEVSIYKSLVCFAQDIIPERKWLFVGMVITLAGDIGIFLLSLPKHNV
jgi:hypothetical protein